MNAFYNQPFIDLNNLKTEGNKFDTQRNLKSYQNNHFMRSAMSDLLTSETSIYDKPLEFSKQEIELSDSVLGFTQN